VDATLRRAIEPFASRKAAKWVGDCYLLAYAMQSEATLVTFHAGLHSLARKQGHSAVIPS
jgi:hypothetical protein